MKLATTQITIVVFVLLAAAIVASSPHSLQTFAVADKSLGARLALAHANLHTPDSEGQIRRDFPDIQLVYVDNPKDNPFYPKEILPFKYYYSKEADRTFNICAVHLTVFICKGKLDRKITDADVDSGRCEVTPIYRSAV